MVFSFSKEFPENFCKQQESHVCKANIYLCVIARENCRCVKHARIIHTWRSILITDLHYSRKLASFASAFLPLNLAPFSGQIDHNGKCTITIGFRSQYQQMHDFDFWKQKITHTGQKGESKLAWIECQPSKAAVALLSDLGKSGKMRRFRRDALTSAPARARAAAIFVHPTIKTKWSQVEFTQNAEAHLHANLLILGQCCVNTPTGNNWFRAFLHATFASTSASCANGASSHILFTVHYFAS